MDAKIKHLSAQEYYLAKLYAAERFSDRELSKIRVTRLKNMEHLDYMEMMEDYADYMCKFEKEH